jgi:saccharopine dehydrogenase-like NADP-dependent oxidoreductase
MARSTGYTATAGARLLINQLFTAKGVFPPEKIGSNNACFEYVLKHLKERNVVWKREEQQIQ